MVDDGFVHDCALHAVTEVLHGGVGYHEGAELAEEEVSGVAGLVGGLGELGAAFAYLERVDGELLQVVVEGEFEAVGEGRLNQEPHLLRAGATLDVGDAVEGEGS